MASSEPTIVIGKLDDKALQESIDKLLRDVHSKMGGVSRAFEAHLSTMQNSLNTFATTMKTVKSDVGDMSKSFEAMFKAMSSTGGASGGGKGGSTTGGASTTASAPNTIGELREQIKLQGQIVDQQVRSTAEKERQVNKQRQLTNELEKELRSTAQSRLQRGLNMQPQGLDEAQRKLQYLQAVQRRYASTTQLSAQEQRNLANAIARTQREIAKINNTRPKTLKEVLGMDESSVDAITRKMRELKRVQISDPAQVNNLSSAYQRLTDKRREMLGQNQLLENSNLSLARSFNYIRNRLVYAFTIGAVMNFTRELVRVRAEYEMLDRSLGILIGDMEKGTQIFNELNEMALKSPFTLIELGTAAKQLTAYNFAANEVVDTTRRLADISAALGVPMERLTYNLGQIKAQGVLNARDARDFANAGLAIVPMLAQLYTKQKRFGDEIVTTAQVYDMMSKKMVSYGDVLHVLTDITDEGGKFFDFQARQADTLKVQLANLTLAYNNMLNEIGTDNQGIISGALGMLRSLAQNWKTVKNAILTVVTALGAYNGAMAIAYLWSKRMAISGAIETFIGLAKEVKTAKNAILLFNMVCKANPLGILVSLLATAGVAFLTFGDNVEEASESVNMFGENASKQINKVESLTKVLKAVKQGTNTYKNALGELNQIAQEYGIEEIKTLDELIVKREHLIELIQREGAERTYANNIAKSQEKYDKGVESTINELRSALQENYGEAEADAYSAIIEDVLTRNIDLIVGKSGKELDKGFREIQEKIKEGLRNAGLSDLEINVLFHTNQSDINKAQNGILKLRNEQTIYNATIENYHKNATKATKATMTWQERLNANQKALRDVSKDAMALYNRMYEMVELAQKNKNNDIRFNLKLVADEPPAWMSKMPIEKLRELAVRFGALAQSGTRVKGHQDDADYAYMRYVQYTSAYRTAQEKAAQDNNKTTKTRTKQSDKIADALKNEISLVKKLQGEYDTLTKKGASYGEAMEIIQSAFGRTISVLNKDLQKLGLPKLDLSVIKGNNPNEVLAFFENLRNILKSKGLENLERLKVVEGVIEEFKVKAKTYNLEMITKGLNNELDKLKDEYELALELDANPELGGIFEQLFDINPSQLPRTVQEYSDMVTKALNEKLKEGKVGVELADLLGMRKGKMDEIVNSLPENSVWRDIITKAWKEIHEANKKAVTDAAKEWDKQVEKYGKLQDKLIRISKDGAQARFNVIKQFGSEEEKASSKTLIDNIMKEQDPQKIATQMEELMKRVNAIIARNPNAKVVIDATINQTSKDISKAYWEDFKDSDLYSMTFENMSKNSTRAIQLIVDKLDLLKDKVKEDPASMKALTDSLNKAQDELVKRNPLKALVQSLGELKNARQGVKTATEALGTADGKVAYWEEQVKKLRDSGEDEKYIDAQDELAKAKEKQAKAQVNLAQAENRERTAKEKMVDSLDKTQQAMEATQGAFNALSNAFRAFGDDDTADMLGEIANGFAMIIPVVVAVAVAIKTLKSTSVILLAISAALAVIIGMVSWLSGRSDKKIVEQIKESERAVKRLENAYRNLEATTENAYGAMVSGAQKALQANKKLQLAELQRQLTLERSRDSKHRDEDRIAELEGQIQDLRNEIKKASQDIVNDLLGISSAGDGVTSLVDAMIDAFRNGEDAMEAFSKKWDEMIDNMILKLMVSYYMQREWDKIMDTLKKMEDQFLEKSSADYEKAVREQDRFNNQEKWQQAEDYLRSTGLFNTDDSYERRIITNLGDYFEDKFVFGGVSSEGMRRIAQIGITDYESFWEKVGEYQQGLVNDVERAEEATNQASLKFTEWSYEYMKGEGYDRMKSAAQNLFDNLDQFYTFGQDNEKELSALQRGIQGITEDTAGALEAITNGISQQCYLQSDLLTQIRDTVQSFDIDVQTSTFAEMLLQLQISTQTQNAIRSIMEGWSSPNGMSVRVEMV